MRWKMYVFSSIIILLGVIVISLIFHTSDNNKITGLFSFVEIAPAGFEFIQQGNVTEEMASQAMREAKVMMAEMKEHNFTLVFVNDVYNEAEIQYNLKNFTEVLKMVELIKFINKEKVKFIDLVALSENKTEEYKDSGVEVSEAQELIKQSMEAFANDQMVGAQELLKKADEALEAAKIEKERQRNIAYLSKNFVIKYWWQILVIIAIICLASLLAVKTTAKKRLHKKLKELIEELDKNQELIKQLQKECFIENKITTDTYRQKSAKYEERITKIKYTIPVIEAQLGGGKPKILKK